MARKEVEMSETGAICEDCQKAMLDPETESCSKNILLIAQKNGQVMERFYRNNTYFDKNQRCHDCGILNKPGNPHHYGCDIERCPKCGLQLISCECFHGMSLYITDKNESVCSGDVEIKQPADLPDWFKASIHLRPEEL